MLIQVCFSSSLLEKRPCIFSLIFTSIRSPIIRDEKGDAGILLKQFINLGRAKNLSASKDAFSHGQVTTSKVVFLFSLMGMGWIFTKILAKK